MNLGKLHHIAIIGSDYKKSKEFYVEKLGFQVVKETFRPQRNDYKIDLQLEGYEIELFIMPFCPKRPSYPEACGLRHLAFWVKDIDQAVEWLKEKGIQCEPIRIDELTGKRMTFFFDPDQLPLELHE